MFARIEKRIFDDINKISNMWVFRVLRKSFLDILPLVLVSSIATMFYYFPENIIFTTINNWTHGLYFAWIDTFYYGISLTFGYILSITIAFTMVKNNPFEKKINTHFPIIGGLAVVSHFIVQHIGIASVNGLVTIYIIRTLPFHYSGLYKAVFVSFAVITCFLWLDSRAFFRKKRQEQFNILEVSYSFQLLIPLILSLLMVMSIYFLIHYSGLALKMQQAFAKILCYFSNITAIIILEGLTMFLSYFSIDGMHVMGEVGYFLSTEVACLELCSYISEGFISVFSNPGGVGATLSLLVAMLLVGRKRSDNLARHAILPSLLNTNHLLLFGVPVVFNPFMFIPFIITPVILSVITYGAIRSGFIELIPHTADLHWFSVVFLGGYIATGSWKGVLLQLFNTLLGVGIYWPFVKRYDQYELDEFQKVYFALEADIFSANPTDSILDDESDVGKMARILFLDLQHALSSQSDNLYLAFQPQMTIDNELYGVEALLRWKHKKLGYISPPVVLYLAKAGGIDIDLGEEIFISACRSYRKWLDDGFAPFQLSINVIANQIMHRDIIERMEGIIKTFNIHPSSLELELSENDLFDTFDYSKETLMTLHEQEYLISLDDFGAGHSSIRYIKSIFLDTIKIDEILVVDVVENEATQRIISAIADLTRQMDITLIAEHVETIEQVEMLHSLGCHIFQGWYYSKALPPKEFEAFYADLMKEKKD